MNKLSIRRGQTCVVALIVTLAASAARAASDVRLIDAAKMRDRAAVARLLKQGADVNTAAPDGSTALHWAVHRDDLDTATLLIRARARVNAANHVDATPLWLASENGSVPMIEALVKAGADPNTVLEFGETPLMAAARTGNERAVRALLIAGARIDAREGRHGQTALMWAAAENQRSVLRELVERGANVNDKSKSGFTPLMFVARQGNLDAAKLLLDKGADVNAASSDGFTSLVVATVRGHVDLALMLLDRGADPNASGTGYTALHWVSGVWESWMSYLYQFSSHEWAALAGIPSREGKIRLIKSLIAHHADVNAPLTQTPPRTINSLFPDVYLKGGTPFLLAAVAADREVLQILKDAGADMTVRSTNGNTPLLAASGGWLRADYETKIPESQVLATVKQLREWGGEVNVANASGETPLHAAALAGLDSVVEYLVGQGALVSAKTKEGRTPLDVASGTEISTQLLVRRSTAALLQKLGGVAAKPATRPQTGSADAGSQPTR